MSDHHSIVKEQPESVPSPSVHRDTGRETKVRAHVSYLKDKFTTRHGWLGDYDYAWLCTPTLPFAVGGRRKRKTMPPFYALDSDLPVLLALSCGLQHALAMLAGLITPPIIFASALSLDAETSAYMISASLIGCGESFFFSSLVLMEGRVSGLSVCIGILSLVQMSRIRLFKNYYLGTGLITVVGTSFATLGTANAVSTARECSLTVAC